jgi:MFS family permease
MTPVEEIGKFKQFYKKYEHRLSSLAFLVGFILDNILLKRVDHWITNTAFSAYILIAAISIIVINGHQAGRFKGPGIQGLIGWLPPLIQFLFGGLMSGFIVFYSRSASLVENWPFIVFLVTLVIGNEIFRRRYSRLTFQLAIFFVTSFSYFIFLVPVIMGGMGARIFIISGIVSFLVFGIMLGIMRWIAPIQFRQNRLILFLTIVAIYALFNFAYFADIIPPVPLSLKELGVYHVVSPTISGNYLVSFEPSKWYPIKEVSNVYHRKGIEGVYVFSSVFAPTKLTAPIVHRWLYFDPKKNDWVDSFTLRFPITGGRDNGYRGYSTKSNITPGKWRVDVLTGRGQLIGRITFDVIQSTSTPELITAIR